MDICGDLHAGHDMAVAHMNSKQLWPHAPDLHKIKPAKILASFSWEAIGNWGKVIFLQGCGPWKATQAPVDGPTPMHIQVAVSQLGGFKREIEGGDIKLGRRSGEELEGEGMGVGVDQNTLNSDMQFSIKNMGKRVSKPHIKYST